MSTQNSSTPQVPVESTPETNVISMPPAPAGSTAVPASGEPESRQGRPASLWNKAQLLELALGEEYCLVAMQERFTAIFTKAEFPPARLTAFQQKIIAARNQTAAAGQSDTAGEELTLEQAEAKKLLVADIRKVQAAAKQKHARTNPTALKDYLVGTNVTQSNAALQQHSQTVLKKLESERPPSIDTEFIEKMAADRTAYVGGNVTQGSSDSKAEEERFKRDQQIDDIKDERIAIQYVIDTEFGPGEAANASVRRQFGLPANRPFNAVRRKAA